MPVNNGEGSWDDDEVVTPQQEAPSTANVSTTSPGPGQSSTAPDADTEPQPATDDELSSEPEEELPEFDPKFREDFDGLLFIGKLTDEFTWLGHKFVIRTLVTDEILEVGLIHKKYAESLADVKAYQAAIVAACVVTVDGRPLSVPITNELDDTELLNKFFYVKRSWFPPVLDVLYDKYLSLEERADKVLRAMGKASG